MIPASSTGESKTHSGIKGDFARRFPSGTEIRAERFDAGAEAEITVLFGPSGSGKTTVLRCIAGLDRPDRGTISCDGVVWSCAEEGLFVPPRRRCIGFVPQDYALFPHLSVDRNISYGIEELPHEDRRARVQELIRWLQLDGMEDRLPRELSGGQQQRVALGRAVARRPRLLLLDEPLSSLDSPTRIRLRYELRKLIRQFGVPAIVVTHDRTEAMALGDRVIVMDEGRIIQQGAVLDVFNRPATLAAASIVGMETVIQGKVLRQGDGLAYVNIGDAVLTAVARDMVSDGEIVYACIRAEDVILSMDEDGHSSPRNRLSAVVRSFAHEGSMVRVEMECGFPLTALLTRQSWEEMALSVNSPVFALVKAPQVHLIPHAE